MPLAAQARAQMWEMWMTRLLSITLATLMLAGAAVAQTGDAGWPDRPIRLVVPFPAGSSTDIVARIIAQKLGQRLGQQIVVENRAGASGNIGVDAVAKAAPDGYTIGIATASTQAVAVSLGTNLPYDPIKDFASVAHLATALFASMAGVNMTHVPYKSSAQSMTDMITGRLDMQFATIAPSLPNIRAGQLRPLVTSGKTRVAALPEVPTVAESGIIGYEAALWVALVAPPATPPATIARLNREVNDILDTAEGKEAMIAQGMAPEPGPPEAVTERTRTDIEKWRGVVAKAGIRAE